MQNHENPEKFRFSPGILSDQKSSKFIFSLKMFLNDNEPGFCQSQLVLRHYKSLSSHHGDHGASKIAENEAFHWFS